MPAYEIRTDLIEDAPGDNYEPTSTGTIAEAHFGESAMARKLKDRRAQRALRRQVRRDLVDLRRDNPEMSASEFKQLAKTELKSEYQEDFGDGIEWDVILKLIEQLLPLILKLLIL